AVDCEYQQEVLRCQGVHRGAPEAELREARLLGAEGEGEIARREPPVQFDDWSGVASQAAVVLRREARRLRTRAQHRVGAVVQRSQQVDRRGDVLPAYEDVEVERLPPRQASIRQRGDRRSLA